MSQYTREDLRKPALITSVFRGVEDHGIETVVVWLVGPGWCQSFGSLCMKSEDESKQFVRELCEVFDVADPERLTDQKCIALYSESPHATIEGLEAPNGKRFTITGWRRRHYPENAPTPTENRRASLERDVAFHTRQLAEAQEKLAGLGTLIDWDSDHEAGGG